MPYKFDFSFSSPTGVKGYDILEDDRYPLGYQTVYSALTPFLVLIQSLESNIFIFSISRSICAPAPPASSGYIHHHSYEDHHTILVTSEYITRENFITAIA
ncbi:hypothetical protein HAX54_043858 [Datura stramonium]|uniref:Uncharacterized protein n=1 Tax=Datura stramonium TaxID=4076 RepID=A0ABS8W484_DATST|nr:hypothetical protein [Datura stramonium]